VLYTSYASIFFEFIRHNDYVKAEPFMLSLPALIGWITFFFEGTTNVLPIMNASDGNAIKKFHLILAMALGSLCLIYCLYGLTFYLVFG
jgi:hypothetical protein